MSKKIYGSILLILVLNFVIKPLYIFGIDLTVQNKVGTQAYGNYFALLNLTLIFHGILEMGIYNYNNREVAKNPNFIQKNFGNILALKFVLALIYLGSVFFAAYLIKLEQSKYYLLLLLLLNQIFLSYFLYLRTNISGLQKFKTDSFLSVAEKSLGIFFVGFLLIYPLSASNFNIETFVYGQLCASCLALGIAIFITFRFGGYFKFDFNLKNALHIFKKSLPFASIALLMGIYFKTDAVMLERMLPNGSEESGIYASGYRILDALNMIPILIAGIVYPRISNRIAQNENYEIEFWMINRFLLLFGVSSAILLFHYSEEIVFFLYQNASDAFVTVFKILVLSFIPLSLISNFGIVLLAHNKLKAINCIAFCATIINIVFNYWVIPLHKASGAAFVTLLTQILIVLFYAYFAYTYLKLKWEKALLFKFILFSISSFVLVAYFSENISQPYFSFFLSLFTIIFISFVMNLVNIKQILKFFKKPI